VTFSQACPPVAPPASPGDRNASARSHRTACRASPRKCNNDASAHVDAATDDRSPGPARLANTPGQTRHDLDLSANTAAGVAGAPSSCWAR